MALAGNLPFLCDKGDRAVRPDKGYMDDVDGPRA